MDVDAHRLELMLASVKRWLGKADIGFKITWTQNARSAITWRDYVITTLPCGWDGIPGY